MDNLAKVARTDTPPLRYLGSKWRLADWIIAQFPPHKVYVEPFAGGASVFFRKHRSVLEVINDMDGEVVNFFQVLRTRTEELLTQIKLTPWAREEYMLALEPADESDVIERARRFYVALNQSFGSTLIYNSGWRHQCVSDMRTPLVDTWRRMDGLLAAAERLKDAQIDKRPATDVIQTYDGGNTLFYVDPPYPLRSRADKGRKRYRMEMDNDDHRLLAEVLHGVDGMVILSGYGCELYDDLFGDWARIEKSTTTNGNSSAIEVLWLNDAAVDHNKLPLFAHGRHDASEEK